jgi:lactoylglutathione lyase
MQKIFQFQRAAVVFAMLALTAGSAPAKEVPEYQTPDGKQPFVKLDFPPFPVEHGRIRFFHVSLAVEDLDRSIDFYVNKLGFKLLRTQDVRFQKMAFIATGDGEPIIELVQIIKPLPGMKTEGFLHLGLFADDVDTIYKESREKGVEWSASPRRYGPGAPYLGFATDPDGYEIEILENPVPADCVTCHRAPHLD